MAKGQPPDPAGSTQSFETAQAAMSGDVAIPQVLYLVDQLSRGGAAQVVVHTALSLDKSKYSPIVCTTRAAPRSPLDDLLEAASIPVIRLSRRFRGDLLAWRELWRLLPAVTILHSHETGSNFWGRIWGRLFGVPAIVTQDHTAANEKPRLPHLADRLLSRASDRIVAVSEFDKALLIEHERIPPDKVTVVYNGIEPARFAMPVDKREARRRAGLPDDGLLIAVIARLAEQKNHAVLFEALTLLPDDLASQIRCLVIGGGPLEATLKESAHRWGLSGVVSFLGERSDIPTVLKAIDMLVLPSRWECLPMVLLEALAARTPIVATAVGGVPEALGSVGWPLVDHTDPAGLAEAIASIARMPSSRIENMAEVGERLVHRDFTRRISAEKIQHLYDSLLGDASEGGSDAPARAYGRSRRRRSRGNRRSG